MTPANPRDRARQSRRNQRRVDDARVGRIAPGSPVDRARGLSAPYLFLIAGWPTTTCRCSLTPAFCDYSFTARSGDQVVMRWRTSPTMPTTVITACRARLMKTGCRSHLVPPSTRGHRLLDGATGALERVGRREEVPRMRRSPSAERAFGATCQRPLPCRLAANRRPRRRDRQSSCRRGRMCSRTSRRESRECDRAAPRRRH